jgi:hypothetical protein
VLCEAAERSGFLRCAAHDEAVCSFGRNDGCSLGLGEQAITVEVQAERAGRRWIVVTLGVLRCAQNDGKNLRRQNDTKTYDGKTTQKLTTAKQQQKQNGSKGNGVMAGLTVFTPSIVVTCNVCDGWGSRIFVAGVR